MEVASVSIKRIAPLKVTSIVFILDFFSLLTLFALLKLGIEYSSVKIYLLLCSFLDILVFLLRKRCRG